MRSPFTTAHKPRWAARVAGVAIIAALAACGGNPNNASTTDKPKSGGTLVMAIPQDPPAFNPDTSTGFPQQLFGCMVYEGLVTVDASGNFQPVLAKSWTVSSDGLTYTFELRDTTWHDGLPFTSDDVKWSLLNVSAKYGAIFAPAAKAISAIDASSPHRVVITLNKPFGPFLYALGCQQGGAIEPKHLLEGTDILNASATLTKPVGTGPFMMGDWVRGDHLTMTRNPKYWDPGKPYLDKVVSKVIPDPSSRNLALQSGEVSYVYAPWFATSDLPSVDQNKKLATRIVPTAVSDDLLFFNTRNAPYSNAKVRQALFMAIDRSYLLKAVFLNHGAVGRSSIEPQIPWAYNPEVDYSKMYPFDVAKAKQMLDAAGYPVGANGSRFNLRLLVRADQQDYINAAQAMEKMWQAVGVTVQVNVQERNAQQINAFKEFKWDGLLQGYTSYGDPALGIARQFVSSSIGVSFGNASGYSNSQIDDLFKKGESATTLADRGKFYKQAQVIIAQDLPSAPLHVPQSYDASTNRLHGLWDGGNGLTWAGAYLS